MNENILLDSSLFSVSDGNVGISSTAYTDGGPGSSRLSSGNFVSSGNVSGADLSVLPGMADSTAALPAVSGSDVSALQGLEMAESSLDVVTLLQDIDETLDIICFFIIFAWCCVRIKNAVRSFTGRGLDKK